MGNLQVCALKYGEFGGFFPPKINQLEASETLLSPSDEIFAPPPPQKNH
jgi:hypothetical protein